jgi:hypothetical protein
MRRPLSVTQGQARFVFFFSFFPVGHFRLSQAAFAASLQSALS